MSKVITAETVMKKYEAMANLKTDGPKAALRKMEKTGTSSIFVRESGQLKGIVTAKACRAAADRGDKTLEAILDTDINMVAPETPANELFSMLADEPYPIAVVTQDGHLKGIVAAGSLLAKLSEVTNPENGNELDAQS
jgi:glycine betaine/proline transport system ATP-binding protein